LLARNRQRWTEPFVRVIHSDVDKRDRTAVKLVRVRWGIVPFCRGFVSPYFLRPREVMRVMAADPPLEPLHAICVVAVQPDEDCSQLLSVLARSEYGPCVTGITRAGAGDDEVSAMAGECLSGLEYLSLHEGSITDTGARALAGWSSVSRTESLDLHGNRIGDSGAGALAASPYLQSAQRIFLSGNLIGPTGWRRLRDRFGTRLFGAPQD
jgi:hypothetical protein